VVVRATVRNEASFRRAEVPAHAASVPRDGFSDITPSWVTTTAGETSGRNAAIRGWACRLMIARGHVRERQARDRQVSCLTFFLVRSFDGLECTICLVPLTA